MHPTSDMPHAKKMALMQAMADIFRCVAINKPDVQEEIMVACTHDVVKREPDEAICLVISLIHEELPGYQTHRPVESTLEMLEGMLALRRMIREEGTLCS